MLTDINLLCEDLTTFDDLFRIRLLLFNQLKALLL